MKKILLDPNDTVELVVQPGDSGISPGSKIARFDLQPNSPIVKLGATIGVASQYIEKGAKVDHRVMQELRVPQIYRKESDKDFVENLPEHLQYFDGYINIDGSVATRNYLCISTSVQCVSGVVEFAANRIRNELLPNYQNVDGVVVLTHTYGCGVAINAKHSEIPRRTLSNIMLNPNFGGYALIIGLGCEKLRHDMMIEEISGRRDSVVFDSLYLQSVTDSGFNAVVEAVLAKANTALERLNNRVREPVSISKLVVGMQCGGSDAFSGLTANPVLGRFSDMLVRAGGSSIFSETTECMDAEQYLMDKCVSGEVANVLKAEFEWYRQYLAQFAADSSANTTPGNREGGLSSIAEKTLGSVAKSGSQRIVDVIRPGCRLTVPGLNFLSGPASDFICGTLQLAAGANMHIFTTGRGTPYSIDGFPVVKVSSNSEIFEKWFDIIDFDSGRVIQGEELNQCAIRLFELIRSVASGRQTAAEKLGIKNSIVLFNPAPIT
jgi:galactarate dehydratase